MLSTVKTCGLEKELTHKMEEANKSREETRARQDQYERLIQEEIKKLEVVGSLTADEAREEIKKRVVDEAHLEASKEVRKIEENAKKHANEEACKIITMAVQRLASDHVAESTVSVVELPDEIGRAHV